MNKHLAQAFDVAKRYFNLNDNPNADKTPYNFAVQSNAPHPKGFTETMVSYLDLNSQTGARDVFNSVGRYFDLQSDYRASYKLAQQLLDLGGHLLPVKVEKHGRVLVQCDEAFAEKMRALKSVAAVTPLAEEKKMGLGRGM